MYKRHLEHNGNLTQFGKLLYIQNVMLIKANITKMKHCRPIQKAFQYMPRFNTYQDNAFWSPAYGAEFLKSKKVSLPDENYKAWSLYLKIAFIYFCKARIEGLGMNISTFNPIQDTRRERKEIYHNILTTRTRAR